MGINLITNFFSCQSTQQILPSVFNANKFILTALLYTLRIVENQDRVIARHNLK